MSRSYKKTPIFGMTTAKSEKEYKVAQHRVERSRVRTAINSGDYESIEVEMAPYNDWDAPCDGKHYWPHPERPNFGWGIHNPETPRWSSETSLKTFRKLMRK
jgi:hypothetical protein